MATRMKLLDSPCLEVLALCTFKPYPSLFPQDHRAINLFCENERHSHYDNVGFTADMKIATGKLC